MMKMTKKVFLLAFLLFGLGTHFVGESPIGGFTNVPIVDFDE